MQHGSENLRSMATFWQCTGMILGALSAGIMNQYWEPKWCFLAYSSISVFVSASALNLSNEIDQKGIENMKGFWTDLKRSVSETWQIKSIPVIYMTLGYLVFSAVLSPSFGEFGFYYNTNVRHV